MRLNGTVFSKVLGMDTDITVVTPNSVKAGKKYKVVYLLHGLCGNSRTWIDYSMLPVYASSGNTIYIMPEAARSFYTDMKYGARYFSYVTEELPEICKSFFNITSERENTAIMGGSMGGYGALKCALTMPERYGVCAAFSSGCLFMKEGFNEMREKGPDSELIENFGEQLMYDFKAIAGENYELRPENDILKLVDKAAKGEYMPQFYLTCGTEDCFYNDHINFCRELEKRNIKYEFETWKARHNFIYFNDALKRAIDKFEL